MAGFGFGARVRQRRATSGTPTPSPTLNALTLAASGIVENSAAATVVGGLLGTTSGSALSLALDAGGRFAIAGGNLVAGLTATDYEAATSHAITVRETLAGATNTPRDTGFVITVSNVFEAPALGALGLSVTAFYGGVAVSGTITGATTGSSIAATGLPAGLTINGAARTFAWSGVGSTAASTVTLTETLADSANSPRASNVNVTVTAYSSATRYSFAATRFRTPINIRAISGANNYLCAKSGFGTPDYAVSNPRFFMPSWYQLGAGGTSPETASPNTITIEALAVKVSGTWYPVPSTNLPVTIDPATSPGVVLDAIPVTIPAGSFPELRLSYFTPAGGSLPTTPINRALGEATQGGTTSLAAKVTDNSVLTNTNVHSDIYLPLYMIGQGGDGRPVVALFGDSIGYGVTDSGNFNSTVNNWSARGTFGYLGRGLDDNSATKRIANANFCVPGSRPLDITSRTDTFCKKKLDSIKAAFTATGDWPFDEIISQHGTNSVSGSVTTAALIAGMQTYLGVIKGDSGKPVTQVELIAKAATTDGFATLANMTPSAQDAYSPVDRRWSLNAAIGTNGVPDPAATLRASGHIQDSFAPWLYGSYDTGANRDRMKLFAFNTTLAAAAAQNATSFSMTAAPTVGDAINIAYTGGYADGQVLSVTGSGPYTVTMVMNSNIGASGAPSGAAVRAEFHALDGTHPGTPAHRDHYASAVTAWKTRRGWV